MVNITSFIQYIVSFMIQIISTLRNSIQFTFGFFTISFFDVVIATLLTVIIINVLWKGGKA